jgi:predicted NAD/FAD-binding protein
MLVDIPRFWRDARQVLADGDTSVTLAEFLDEQGYSQALVDLHLIPMGASIWSADPTRFAEFPAVSLFGFLDNHGLLGLRDRPKWRTVVGGSQRYIDAITARFDGTIVTNAQVTSVLRADGGVEVTARGVTERFDKVVLACHTDQTLELLADATPDEKDVLGSIDYQPNFATLHTDTSVMAPQRRAWSAWNYEIVEDSEEATLTYDLTTLQRLPGSRRYLVSLNLDDRIDPSKVIDRFRYAHPVFDHDAIEAQRRLPEIDGVDGVHFAGAWAGHGFHEDGFTSAVATCARMGVTW